MIRDYVWPIAVSAVVVGGLGLSIYVGVRESERVDRTLGPVCAELTLTSPPGQPDPCFKIDGRTTDVHMDGDNEFRITCRCPAK